MSTCVGYYTPNCARVLEGFVSGLSKSVSPSKYVYFALIKTAIGSHNPTLVYGGVLQKRLEPFLMQPEP